MPNNYLWPATEQFRREVELSQRLARRDAERRRRQARRQFTFDAVVAAAVLAMALLVIWILAPGWVVP